MDEIKQHPWFLESEPDTSNLPIPPSPSQIGRPVSDPSEIDDRILETIKFLWGESSDDAVVRALISKEYASALTSLFSFFLTRLLTWLLLLHVQAQYAKSCLRSFAAACRAILAGRSR